MRSRVTVVCLSVTVLTARVLISAIKHGTTRMGTILTRFFAREFAKMALFPSYALMYLGIGAAIHEVLFVLYSYPNDDTETVTFDLAVMIVQRCLRLSCPSESVSVHDWLKNGFVTHEVNAEVA